MLFLNRFEIYYITYYNKLGRKCVINPRHGLELTSHNLELIDISDWLKIENICDVDQSQLCKVQQQILIRTS